MDALKLIALIPLLASSESIEVVDVSHNWKRSTPSETCSDVMSCLSERDYRDCKVDQHRKSVDIITQCHEGTHFLNASIGKPGWHGFYIGGGRAIRIKIPNCRISHIDIPEDLKDTSTYRIYIKESRKWWDRDPLYIFDECLAYLNGAKVRKEMGWDTRKETITYGKRLLRFSQCAFDAIKMQDLDYDSEGLEAFLKYLESEWEQFDD